MRFTIDWCESLTSSKGNTYKKCSVTDESGRKLENVAVFSFFTDFAKIMPGATVEGVLEQKEFKGSVSYSLGNMVSTAFTRDKANGGAFKGQSGAVKAAEITSNSVKEHQESKHEAIRLAGAQRDAVLIVTTFMKFDEGFSRSPDLIKEKIKDWMKFFLDLGEQPFI